MDEREEQIEKEIQERKARIAKILESLTDIEDNIGKTPASMPSASCRKAPTANVPCYGL
jgi:DNA-binding protein H-NS